VKLHSFWRSSASWRVRIALRYKGLPFEYVPVNLGDAQQYQDGYRALNPMEQVPTLTLDDGRKLSQSLAIIEYLDETVPSPALLPRDPYLRARTRQLAEVVNSGIQPLQNTSPLNEVKRIGGDPEAWGRKWVEKGLLALERTAADTAGRFLVGDSVSLADVCLVPQLGNARRFGLDLAPFPLLVRVEAACDKLDAFASARPEQQPDAPR
jgi:maleylpyruvate isomerase